MQPSPERVVDRTAIAGGGDREAGILLDFLQKIIDLDVGITVVAILHLRRRRPNRRSIGFFRDRGSESGRRRERRSGLCR